MSVSAFFPSCLGLRESKIKLVVNYAFTFDFVDRILKPDHNSKYHEIFKASEIHFADNMAASTKIRLLAVSFWVVEREN